MIKRLQMEITIQELGDSGDYEAVEITNKSDVPCVGIFQLKQVYRVTPPKKTGPNSNYSKYTGPVFLGHPVFLT